MTHSLGNGCVLVLLKNWIRDLMIWQGVLAFCESRATLCLDWLPRSSSFCAIAHPEPVLAATAISCVNVQGNLWALVVRWRS